MGSSPTFHHLWQTSKRKRRCRLKMKICKLTDWQTSTLIRLTSRSKQSRSNLSPSPVFPFGNDSPSTQMLSTGSPGFIMDTKEALTKRATLSDWATTSKPIPCLPLCSADLRLRITFWETKLIGTRSEIEDSVIPKSKIKMPLEECINEVWIYLIRFTLVESL